MWTPVIALMGVLVTAGVTYFAAARRLSGRIRDTEATDLWKAQEALRRDMTADNRELRALYAECKKENDQLRHELGRLRERLERWEPLGNG